ncbi:prepilin peptidase [Sediminibacillus dalangtanensis]|uniref:Prepilin peptidase n=1 Tax=Sediminibacillus dalangtanensis TaxID=2729421 RepID=A0ABX7W057_9BACI|nr:A24 family peptidase [Sediminibacillus dalangtanensis]QTN01521.1 prepilin peptidase [Sediminibacillus dalangtanensis]
MTIFYLCYFFILGLIFGSFFNVVGMRVPRRQLFAKNRSYCPHCLHSLKWYELIPVLSYLLQKGRCRHCRGRISPIYPVTELGTGLLFAACFWHVGFQVELFVALLLCSMLAIILVSDLRYMEIPDRVLLFFLPLFLAGRIISPLDPWWTPIIGGITGVLLLAAIIVASRGGMGGGDMKLFGVLGIVLGWKNVLLAFFVSTVYGAVITLVLLAIKRIERKKPVPFGPFIVLGSLTVYFFGDKLFNWYLTSFF